MKEKMGNVCIINPPYNVKQSVEEVEHIGIEYIAGFLEHKGINVELYDCPYQNINIKEIISIIARRKYKIIGISVYFYNYLSVKKLLREIYKLDPQIFVFLGGYLPTLSPVRLFIDKKYFDCLVLGEGERTVYELINLVYEEMNWKTVKGIAYFEQDTLKKNEVRELIYNLDTIPFPKRIDTNRCTYSVITSRGCYAHCNFCGIKEFYQRNDKYFTRYRSAQNVVCELKDLIGKCPKLKEIRFNDDNFALTSAKDKEWFETFAESIIENNINLKYSCLLRASDICRAQKELECFKKIGLKMVFIGIESFVQEELEFYNKKVLVEQNKEAIRICDDLNIRYQIGFMMFNPESTLDNILRNVQCFEAIEFNKKNKYYNKPVSNSVVIVTEGTPIEEYVIREGLNSTSKIGYNFRHSNVKKCFDIINEWSEWLKPIGELAKIETYFEENNRTDELLHVRNLFYEVFFCDLRVLKKIATELYHSKDVEKYEWDLSEEKSYINNIYDELMEIVANYELE